MKKIIFILTIIIFLTRLIYSFNDDNIGKFIYYLDTRAGVKKLIGIINLGNDLYFHRIYDMNNNVEVATQITITLKNNKFDIKPSKTSANTKTQKELFQIAFTDLLNHSEIFKNQKFDLFNDLYINDPWPEFNYNLRYEFSDWIPFFKIKSIELLEEKNKCYKLVLIGKIDNENDINKFAVKEIPSTNDFGPNIIIKLKSPKIENINGINISLDDNWINNNGNSNFSQNIEGKHIEIKTKCDAQINFEEGDISRFGFKNYEDFTKSYIFIITNYIYPESVKISKIGDDYLLYYECIDKKNNIKNVSMAKGLKIEGTKYKIINLSMYYNVYINNKKYFDDIINSCKIK